MASLFLFIISPILFIIVLIIVLVVYFVLIRRGKNKGEESTVAKVKLLRSVSSKGAHDLRVSRVCVSIGVGDSMVRLGDRWVSALRINALDSSLLRDIMGLGAIISDNNSNYLVIYGDSPDDVSIRLNTAVELLRSRNALFRQLSSSEVISEVILRWMS